MIDRIIITTAVLLVLFFVGIHAYGHIRASYVIFDPSTYLNIYGTHVKYYTIENKTLYLQVDEKILSLKEGDVFAPDSCVIFQIEKITEQEALAKLYTCVTPSMIFIKKRIDVFDATKGFTIKKDNFVVRWIFVKYLPKERAYIYQLESPYGTAKVVVFENKPTFYVNLADRSYAIRAYVKNNKLILDCVGYACVKKPWRLKPPVPLTAIR